jgi:hypothetical protein
MSPVIVKIIACFCFQLAAMSAVFISSIYFFICGRLRHKRLPTRSVRLTSMCNPQQGIRTKSLFENVFNFIEIDFSILETVFMIHIQKVSCQQNFANPVYFRVFHTHCDAAINLATKIHSRHGQF